MSRTDPVRAYFLPLFWFRTRTRYDKFFCPAGSLSWCSDRVGNPGKARLTRSSLLEPKISTSLVKRLASGSPPPLVFRRSDGVEE